LSVRARAAGLAAIIVAAAGWLFFRSRPRAPHPTRATSTADGGRAASTTGATAHIATPPPPVRAVHGTSIATFGWGDGPNQLGRRRNAESNPEGPMAFVRQKDGTIDVLDQVHGRIVRRGKDGQAIKPITIGAETAQDLRVDGDKLAVLDRLGERSLRRFDDGGRIVDERSLASIGVVEPGGVTGLFEAGGALYVEESLVGESRRVVRTVGAAGNEGPPLPGRPTQDGTQLLSAQLVRSEAGAFLVRGLNPDGTQRWLTSLTVGRPILAITLLDSDEAGGVYAGVLHATPVPGSSSPDLVDERLDLFRLDAGGAPISHVSLAHPPSDVDCFRELEVVGVGIVDWMHPLPAGSGMTIDQIDL
jgi:hypothetical protein